MFFRKTNFNLFLSQQPFLMQLYFYVGQFRMWNKLQSVLNIINFPEFYSLQLFFSILMQLSCSVCLSLTKMVLRDYVFQHFPCLINKMLVKLLFMLLCLFSTVSIRTVVHNLVTRGKSFVSLTSEQFLNTTFIIFLLLFIIFFY